jgi:LmbE family N-acetylglucosaminyl deacetylase
MQMASREVGLKRILFKVSSAFLWLVAASFAQAPSSTSTAAAGPANSPGYLDRLPQDTGAAGLTQALRRLQTTGRLMQVVAHPDDEDGGLLTLEARGKGVQTLLLTLTRGEGGQNKLGSSLFDVLGVLRTLELLASDRYYGVEQRFTRVADFGYSKTADETFQKWGGHDVALADIVRVIREFRPDVLVARFSGTENDGHGHHQASAILTREAFRAAADPNRFPEQIKQGLQPWQAKKLYIGNVCGFGAMTCPAENYTVKLNTGQVDPALGMSYVQFAMEGLRHQLSQGAGAWSVDPGDRFTFYKLVDSVLPNTTDKDGHEKDFFDGIDTSLPGLAARLGEEEKTVSWLRGDLQQIVSDLKQAGEASERTATTAPRSLFDVHSKLKTAIPKIEGSNLLTARKSDLIRDLREEDRRAEKAINILLAVSAENELIGQEGQAMHRHHANIAVAVSPRQRINERFTFHNGSEDPLRIDDVLMKDVPTNAISPSQMLTPPHQDYSQEFHLQVPESLCCTRPYWHRQNPETDSVNAIDDPRYATLPFPPFPLEEDVAYSPAEGHEKDGSNSKFWVGVSVPLVAHSTGANGNIEKRRVAIVPAFSVALEPGEQLLPVTDGKKTKVKVGVSSNVTGAPGGTLHLDLPAGWRAEPDDLKVNLQEREDRQDFEFKVFPANLKEEHTEIRAVLDVGGKRYTEGYTLVTREDLGSFYYYQPALQRVSIVDVKAPKALKVGYVMGAGDEIPTVLQQLGMNVTLIPAEKVATENLSQYGSIVLGVRAYDTQKDVVANNQKLLDFVSNGGTLVVQNNNSVSDFNKGKFTPYPAELSRARVSVEEAPVQILAPDNTVFHYPNEISKKDFEGWVQERGLYFMSSWDDHFTPLLSCHDPNEPGQKGGLLVAKYGKGTYIYTGYAFFRQLPAGVPGAIRLFVNLVSAGTAGSGH